MAVGSVNKKKKKKSLIDAGKSEPLPEHAAPSAKTETSCETHLLSFYTLLNCYNVQMCRLGFTIYKISVHNNRGFIIKTAL